jgi:uncharacterized Zn finger protein (UPF0148 family)
VGRFDTTYDPTSPTEQWKRERSTLNIALFPDQLTGQQNTNPSCVDCKQRLIVVKGQYFCKTCGEFTPIVKPTDNKKLVKKHGTSSGGAMVQSQKSDRKTQKIDTNQFDDDLKADLAGFGYSPED